MSKRLQQNLTSRYLAAAGRMKPRQNRQRIVAYVEGYDDILFWRGVLGPFEDEHRYFEVMLPSHDSLGKGKKVALMNALQDGLGENLIVCVDADYDYLMDGLTEASRILRNNKYVLHTYVYAIENYLCYAPTLHDVCVMATLNDRTLVDFNEFLSSFSRVVYPLYVWSIWCYRKGCYHSFTMADFASTVCVGELNLYHLEDALDKVQHKVNRRMAWLQQHFPQAKADYRSLKDELFQLGVTQENCYLFMRGHDLYDNIVLPLVVKVCEVLRREREREIRRLALHKQQMQNELAGYAHSSQAPEEMLRKHALYKTAPLYCRIKEDVRALLDEKRSKEEKEK